MKKLKEKLGVPSLDLRSKSNQEYLEKLMLQNGMVSGPPDSGSAFVEENSPGPSDVFMDVGIELPLGLNPLHLDPHPDTDNLHPLPSLLVSLQGYPVCESTPLASDQYPPHFQHRGDAEVLKHLLLQCSTEPPQITHSPHSEDHHPDSSVLSLALWDRIQVSDTPSPPSMWPFDPYIMHPQDYFEEESLLPSPGPSMHEPTPPGSPSMMRFLHKLPSTTIGALPAVPLDTTDFASVTHEVQLYDHNNDHSELLPGWSNDLVQGRTKSNIRKDHITSITAPQSKKAKRGTENRNSQSN